MAFTAEPIAGEYYRDMDLEVDFVVVDVDEYEGIITLRREGSDDPVDITLDDWDEMLIEPADSPNQSLGMEDQFSNDMDDLDEGPVPDDDIYLEDED